MIEAVTRQWNEGSSPFTWVKPADEILAKAVRKPRATNESGHKAVGATARRIADGQSEARSPEIAIIWFNHA